MVTIEMRFWAVFKPWGGSGNWTADRNLVWERDTLSRGTDDATVLGVTLDAGFVQLVTVDSAPTEEQAIKVAKAAEEEREKEQEAARDVEESRAKGEEWPFSVT